MVRIGVYRGHEKDKETGLTLFNFDVLNELEETNNTLKEFQLVGRFNKRNWKEPLMEGRIYFVNIIPEERGKPISKYEILDKSKFVKHENGKYLISYRKYSGVDLVEFYEEGAEEAKKIGKPYNDPNINILQDYINFCLSHKKGDRLYFNTFTKFIVSRILQNYGYDDVIKYQSENEYKKWENEISEKVKNFVAPIETKFTDWSNDEIKFLVEHLDRPQNEVAKKLNRTLPSIASMKWKLRNGQIPEFNLEEMKDKNTKTEESMDKRERIGKFIKSFRKEKGYNQKELSKESGISISVISQLECGKYIGTDTPIVEELLNYIDENSSHLKSSMIGEDVNTKSQPQPKKEEIPTVSNTEEWSGESEYIAELLSEIKFMNSRLLKIESRFDRVMGRNSKDPIKGKRRGKIRLTNKLKELQS